MGRGSWVVSRGSWVMGPRSSMHTSHVYIVLSSFKCLLATALFSAIFLACTPSDSEGIVPKMLR